MSSDDAINILFLAALIGNSTQKEKFFCFNLNFLTLEVLPSTKVYKISVIFKLKNSFPIL